MNQVIIKRSVGRPRGTTVGINERLERYRISERCAEFTDEILNFYTNVLRNPVVEVERDGKKVMTHPISETAISAAPQSGRKDLPACRRNPANFDPAAIYYLAYRHETVLPD
jgi:hypothetical protein